MEQRLNLNTSTRDEFEKWNSSLLELSMNECDYAGSLVCCAEKLEEAAKEDTGLKDKLKNLYTGLSALLELHPQGVALINKDVLAIQQKYTR